jgi:hypothetical protein
MAKKCCGSYDPPKADEFICGCGYLNGMCPVITSQILLLIAVVFAVTALFDCSFVEILEPIEVSPRSGGYTSRRLGMLTFQMENGQCHRWNDEFISVETQVQFYTDVVLGPDWQPSTRMAESTLIIGGILLLYMTSYCCSSQVSPIRLAIGTILTLLCMIQLCLSFMVYISSWCEEKFCYFSRSAAFSIAAAICFFFAGCAFCTTTDYPGEVSLVLASAESGQKDMMDVNDGAMGQGGSSGSNQGEQPDGQQP